MPFIIKTTGGPLDGQVRHCRKLEDFGLKWPLPDELPLIFRQSTVTSTYGVDVCDDCNKVVIGPPHRHPTGRYVKVSESILPPEAAANPFVGVGAEYQWEAFDGE